FRDLVSGVIICDIWLWLLHFVVYVLFRFVSLDLVSAVSCIDV
ncbi:unnamed protein product, partial [Brassica oleracea]